MRDTDTHTIPWHGSLVFRSMICIFVLLAIIMGAATYLTMSRLEDDMREKRRIDGTNLVRITAQAVSLPLWNGDKAQIQQQMDTMRRMPTFCGGRVLDSHNKPYLSANFPEKLSADQRIYEQVITYDDPKDAANNLETIGKTEICISNRDLDQRLASTIQIQLIIFAMISAAVLGAYYMSILIIIRPLLQIRMAMEELATTMKPIRESSLTGPNEIGALSHSFNKMVISLSKSYNALKIAKEKAVKADLAKTEFLANMSHELRTPLNIIIGMTQIMDNKDMPGEQRESFSLINRSSQTLLNIVNDILDLTKIEAGEMRLENITFDLGQKVEHVTAGMAALAGNKNLYVKCESDISGKIVMGDPLRFERVLVNLIGNAVRYTDKGGITVKAELKEIDFNKVRFVCEIHDTGIGIAPDKLDKVFDKFSQADTSITRRYGGTGLGLTITKQLVEMMGGKIGVDSEEGVGTTFWFQLPFVLSDRIIEAKPSIMINKGHEDFINHAVPASKARVLLAEDNEINRSFMFRLLERHGVHDVSWVENGRDAVEEVQRSRYDLVLMDCNMPELSGYDATTLIRALPDAATANIPIVALTANAMPEDKDRCIALGMNGYLSKPFKIEEFIDTLSGWIVLDAAPNPPVLSQAAGS